MRARPKEPLVAFAERELGPVKGWRDASWDHGESEVWELIAERGDSAYLKVHAHPRKFDQEVFAYRRWAPATGGTPTLLARHDGARSALLLSAEQGVTALGANLERSAEEKLYENAGRWLARLHAVAHEDTDPVPIEAAFERRAAAWAARAEGQVDAAALTAILEEVSHRLPPSEAPRTRVPCHRDFTARNWLVTPTGALTVFDFEHSRADWFAVDLERVLSSIRAERPELRDSFARGYGPLPSAHVLRRVSLVSALTRITWAVEHNDDAFERRGREELAALLQ